MSKFSCFFLLIAIAIFLSFTSSAQNNNRLESTGNIGIGTNAPSSMLDVNGDFRLGVNNGGTAYSIGFTRSAGAQLYGTTTAGLALGGDVTGTDAVVLPNGNVGIGTTNPGYKLDIQNGSVNIDTGANIAYRAGSYLSIGNMSYTNTYGMSYTNTAYFNGTGNNYFAGNVGINALDTKGYKLAIGGSMIAEKVKVKLQIACPDYVFEHNYQLPALMNVEKYIIEHKHLPDVPMAADVEKEGQDLGEMNKILMQKWRN